MCRRTISKIKFHFHFASLDGDEPWFKIDQRFRTARLLQLLPPCYTLRCLRIERARWPLSLSLARPSSTALHTLDRGLHGKASADALPLVCRCCVQKAAQQRGASHHHRRRELFSFQIKPPVGRVVSYASTNGTPTQAPPRRTSLP